MAMDAFWEAAALRKNPSGSWLACTSETRYCIAASQSRSAKKKSKQRKINAPNYGHMWMVVCLLYYSLGVPTFEKKSSTFGGRYIFRTIFRNVFKNVKSISIGLCLSTCKLCVACLFSLAVHLSLAEFAHREGLSNQTIKKGTFVRVEKLSFWKSPVKIRDVVGPLPFRCCETKYKVYIQCPKYLQFRVYKHLSLSMNVWVKV